MGLGYQCVLQLRKITGIDPITRQYTGTNFVVLVSFLSSGSVTRIKKVTGDFGAVDAVARFPLPNGGYLLMYRKTVRDITFYLLIYEKFLILMMYFIHVGIFLQIL
jgi:hypothetical protein